MPKVYHNLIWQGCPHADHRRFVARGEEAAADLDSARDGRRLADADVDHSAPGSGPAGGGGRREPAPGALDGVSRGAAFRRVRLDRAGADRREDNGATAVDDSFLLVLRQVVAGSPRDYGWARPTWTQELLCLVMRQQTGAAVSQPTMSRCLKAIGARLGRPRPTVGCWWPKARKNRHARRIRKLIETLPADEAAFYADELDVHLNPKIGRDWMLPGQQKIVVTPGKNQKRYLAGARHVRTGRMHWVTAPHKRSGLFIELLRTLDRAYAAVRRIHLIVDNYSIHLSRQTQLALAELPRIQLHFLPPCSPELNPIERVWLDLHAEVTRNHRCTTIEELMIEVHHYLKHRNRQASRRQHKAVA
jgi:transposase